MRLLGGEETTVLQSGVRTLNTCWPVAAVTVALLTDSEALLHAYSDSGCAD